jgi:predicted NUDIX family NTP pyrophosphohydrolase
VRCEFVEETGFAVDGEFLSLCNVTLRSGKRVHVWAVEGDLDAGEIASNLFTMEWPNGSGGMQDFPEIDRGEWLGLEMARRKIFETRLPFLERLVAALYPEGGRLSGALPARRLTAGGACCGR